MFSIGRQALATTTKATTTIVIIKITITIIIRFLKNICHLLN